MENNNENMVKVEKVNKYFNRHHRNQIHIIDNTSFELENKGMCVILGQSGSGKTTLLNAIGGLDKINKGKIYVNGKKITSIFSGKVDKIRNINVGYIFQDYKLLENMSVYDNVALSLKMTGLKDKKEIEKRVNYVLNSVNMYRYRARPAKMLSGGEKQRVAIARAIVKNPNIVIADEPTGNLDSKNSLEIMNILKAISKEKLVILVTHEEDLARFYASRILEIIDGKVVKDYKNEPKESLEYRLDNKIYLKDLKNTQDIQTENFNINVYSEETNNNSNKINVNLVVKNGNIYIKSDNDNVEVVDENSPIEFINEHYKEIDKNDINKDEYSIEKASDKKYKVKYKSIYGIFKSLGIGFKRISNYSVIKKILILGFFASSMFIVYSVCNIKGVQIVKDSDFITTDKNYLKVDSVKSNIEGFEKYERIDGIDYIIPGDGKISFKLKVDDYYQLAKQTYELSGSMVSLDDVNSNDIILGRMPQNEYEIVIDELTADRLINPSNGQIDIRGMGINSNEELINRKVQIDNMNDFTIVGIANLGNPSIYVNKSLFINILNNSVQSSFGIGIYFNGETNDNNETKVVDYNLCLNDIELTKGRMPEDDYEVIVNASNKDTMKLNKQINAKVNDTQLTVVGYYESKTNKQEYLVNSNTVKYDVITKKTGFMVHTKQKAEVMEKLKDEYSLNVINPYEKDRQDYMNKRKDTINNSILYAGIILAISLIEIYLMIRSSFLSRIKEIGVLRAIGVKKADIYRMFLGEIIAITICGSMPGIALMSYILDGISKIKYINNTFIVNKETILISILIICGVNILVGLLPLTKILRKTPAQILARHDVE